MQGYGRGGDLILSKLGEYKLYCELPRSEDVLNLSQEQIEEMYSRYLKGEKLVNLAIEYGVLASSHRLNDLLPPLFRFDKLCPCCGLAMEQKRRPRGSREEKPLKCLLCGHKEEVVHGICRQCRCVHCSEKLKIFQEKKRENNLEAVRALSNKPEGVKWAIVSVRQSFLLLGLMSCSGDDVKGFRTGDGEPLLAATIGLTRNFLAELCEDGLIKASEDELPDNAEDLIRTREFERFSWVPNLVDDKGRRLPVADVLVLLSDRLKNEFKPYWEGEICGLAQAIAVDEAERYLDYLVRRDGKLIFKAYKRLKSSLDLLVRDFSVSAIYGVIWIAHAKAKSALKNDGMKKMGGSVHAGNLIPGIMDRLTKVRLASEGGSILYRKYSRNGLLAEGTVSLWLSAFLGVPDVIFNYSLNQLREDFLRARLADIYRYNRRPVFAAHIAKEVIDNWKC